MFSKRTHDAYDLLIEVPLHRRQAAMARAYNIAVKDIGAAETSKQLEQALKNMRVINDICQGHVEIAALIRAIEGKSGSGPNVVINVTGETPKPDGR